MLHRPSHLLYNAFIQYDERRTVRLQSTQKTGALARIKGLFGAQDMTVGNPMTNILRFAIPLLIGNFAQQLYSTVDSIIVGNFVSKQALAAIGSTTMITNMLVFFFNGFSIGAGVTIGQYFGARDMEKIGRAHV